MAGTRILLRGHYNPTNWSRKYPNLQKSVNPAGEKVFCCTGCIRTFGKVARMKDKKAKAIVAAAAKAAAPKPVAKPAAPAKVKKPKAEKKAAK